MRNRKQVSIIWLLLIVLITNTCFGEIQIVEVDVDVTDDSCDISVVASDSGSDDPIEYKYEIYKDESLVKSNEWSPSSVSLNLNDHNIDQIKHDGIVMLDNKSIAFVGSRGVMISSDSGSTWRKLCSVSDYDNNINTTDYKLTTDGTFCI